MRGPAQVAAGHLAWGRFVGRANELQRLKDATDASFRGNSVTAFIGGEPGIGKTRLAHEVGLYASECPGLVLSGRCYDEEAVPAYTPFVEALQQYISACPSQKLFGELADAAPYVAKLVPQVREHFPDLPTIPLADSEQERFNINDAVAIFLANISVTTPMVLMLDDLHWADRPSLGLLRYLVRKLRTHRVMFVVTYRDGDMSDQLAELMAQLQRESHFEHVQLKGLSAEEAISFLAAVTDPDLESSHPRDGAGYSA